MAEFPSNQDIQNGMKVLVELKKNRGTGTLTEGIVLRKLSNVTHDDNGIVVVLEKDQQGIEQQGRVHKILDLNFIDKNNPDTHISLHPGENLTNRIKVMNLFSRAKDFIWILNGYFLKQHFEILHEVLESNKNISEVKILTIVPRKKKDLERLKVYANLFKDEFGDDVSIDFKVINDKTIGSDIHDRFYYTKNQAYTFIELDTLLRNQRANIDLQPEEDFEKNVEDDFMQYWRNSTSFSLFDTDDYVQLVNYFQRLEQNSKK